MDLRYKITHQLSYWELNALNQKYDFVIVGAGFCGLYSAYFIAEKHPKAKILVLDKQVIGNTASTKNAGFACFGSAGELLDDINNIGLEQTTKLLEMRLKGLELMSKIIPAQAMQYQNYGGWEVFSNNELSDFERISQHLDFINLSFKDLLKSPYTPKAIDGQLPHIKKAIFQAAEGELNPYLLMEYLHNACIKKGIKIIKGVEVFGVEKTGTYYDVFCSDINFKAKKIIICTNLNKIPNLLPDIKSTPARAQVVISEPLSRNFPKGVFHAMAGYTYFRFVDNRLLLGGMRHKHLTAESTESLENTDLLCNDLQAYANNLLGVEVALEHRWAGTMAVGENRFPAIGVYNDVIHGIKMGGMGVAIGAYVGKTISNYV